MIRCLLFPGYQRTFAQGLGILNALWKLEVKQLGTFGLARVRINEVRISEALLYRQDLEDSGIVNSVDLKPELYLSQTLTRPLVDKIKNQCSTLDDVLRQQETLTMTI